MNENSVTDREFVESKWEDVVVIVTDGYRVFLGEDHENEFESTVHSGRQFDDRPAWAAAAEFTHKRVEEIRQIEEETMLLRSMVILLSSEPGDETATVYKRTISRLVAINNDLHTGMKR